MEIKVLIEKGNKCQKKKGKKVQKEYGKSRCDVKKQTIPKTTM